MIRAALSVSLSESSCCSISATSRRALDPEKSIFTATKPPSSKAFGLPAGVLFPEHPVAQCRAGACGPSRSVPARILRWSPRSRRISKLLAVSWVQPALAWIYSRFLAPLLHSVLAGSVAQVSQPRLRKRYARSRPRELRLEDLPVPHHSPVSGAKVPASRRLERRARCVGGRLFWGFPLRWQSASRSRRGL